MTNPYQQPAPNPVLARLAAQAGMSDVARAADNVRRAADSLDVDAQRADMPASVAERKRAAANDLRTYADQIATGDRKYHAVEAHLMANAGECSGILVDGSGKTDEEKQALIKLARDGRMVRVAEDGQVPFYALASYGGPTREEAAWRRNRDDVDEPAP